MEGMQRRLNNEIESHELIGTFYFDLSCSPLPPPLDKAYFLLSVDAFLPFYVGKMVSNEASVFLSSYQRVLDKESAL